MQSTSFVCLRIAKTLVGEAVDFDNALDDFHSSRDDLSGGEEPLMGLATFRFKGERPLLA